MQHLNPWQIELAEWYVEHRFLLKRVFLFTLFFLDLILVGIFAIGFARYNAETISGQELQRRLSQNLIDFAAYRAAHPVLPLLITSAQALRDADDNYDLVALAANLNLIWGVQAFEYRFVVDGLFLPWRTAFILPGDSKFITDFGFEPVSTPSAVSVNARNVSWKKAGQLKLLEAGQDLLVRELAVSRSTEVASFTEVTFVAVNNSAYDFWQAGFTIIGQAGNRLAALNFVTLSDFSAR